MLRRAGISSVVALVGGFWGFSGVLEVTAAIGQTLFYIAVGFTFLSLLFSLFEAPAGTATPVAKPQPAPARIALARSPEPQPALVGLVGRS